MSDETQKSAPEFDPEDAREYLEGVDYPANKGDLISAAEDNGAPEELVEMIGTMGRPEFSDAEEVIAELRARPGGG